MKWAAEAAAGVSKVDVGASCGEEEEEKSN
jgi:hypothetical protein